MKKFILLSMLLVASCTQFHHVKLMQRPCLIPEYRHNFSLCDNYNVIVDDELIVISKGFLTDMASVPRILWPLYAPNDTRTIGPAIMHDFMYSCPYKRTRYEIDNIFYYALLSNKTNQFTAYFYWLGVRVFGSSHFREGYQCLLWL